MRASPIVPSEPDAVAFGRNRSSRSGARSRGASEPAGARLTDRVVGSVRPMSPNGKRELGRRHRILLACERFSRQHYRLVFLRRRGPRRARRLARLAPRARVGHPGPDPARQPRRSMPSRTAIDEFGSISYLIVAARRRGRGRGRRARGVRRPPGRAARGARGAGRERRVPLRSPTQQFLELFYDNALLFLPPERLPELAARSRDEAILRQIAAEPAVAERADRDR